VRLVDGVAMRRMPACVAGRPSAAAAPL